MIGKSRVAVVRHGRRLLCLTFFFTVLFTFRSTERVVRAQSDDLTPSAILFSENFDGVSTPSLPPGWTTSQTGSGTAFVTTSGSFDTPPNGVMTTDPATPGSADLISPSIAIGGLPTRLSFRHLMVTEVDAGYDGGLLEVSVAGGAFQDIVAAGGDFISGGYTNVIGPDATGNPLIGRQVWSGAQMVYASTVVALPQSMANQSVRFRWRFGSDEIFGGPGWTIDTIQVTDLIPTGGGTGIVTVVSNPNPISIPDSGPGAPYPSTITVSNLPNQIGKVTVKLNALSHSFPSDIDVLLVGPAGQTATIMSDQGGGTDVTGVTLTLDDAAPTALPAVLATGTFRPTADATIDNFPAPAPVPSGGSALSIFQGTNPNGTWRLFVVDDAGVDQGSFAGGWTLTITSAVSGNNSTSIAIPESGVASPYPSEIDLSGLTGTVISVIVNVSGLTHTVPDDMDLLLVSPSGACVTLMSDAGGNNAVSNLQLSFDDSAASTLPDSGPLIAGRFKPTDFEPGDSYPAPAPVCTSVETRLGSLFNTQPNGTWKLFAVDDTGGNSGSISTGWSILVNTSTTAIAIPASGAAEPYPSEITISNQTGLVTRVTVGIENFNHTSPDDVDLMLVAPNGRRVVLMSDVGGANPATGISLTFDDLAVNSLPDNTALASGSYRPTDFEPGDLFPAPAPNSGSLGRMLASLNGSAGNGAWRLFLADDNGNNGGTIDRWTLNVQSSPTVIAIPEVGTSSPYPAEIAINGLPGSITKATVTLSNFSHLAPDDVDILLVGPDGRRIVLMSDAGGTAEVGGLNLTFDDTTGSTLPDDGPLASGTYRPADYEQGDAFPSPAPTGPLTGTTLNAFYGGVPNGIWRLFIVDDSGNNFGSIAGNWSVNLTTSTSACLFSISPLVQAFPTTGGNGAFSIVQPNGCAWTAMTNQSFIGITAGNSGSGNGSVSFTVAPNMGPARTGTIDVSNGVTTRSFQVQQPSGCPFSLSQNSASFGASGGSGSISVTAGGVCTWQGSTTANWIQITSTQQTGNGMLTFNVQPNAGTVPRSATITVGGQTVNVTQSAAGRAQFDFDGDSRSDISVYRPSNGSWWILRSGQPGAYTALQFGISTDKIVPADYDGDRKADIAVFRDGAWYLLLSETGTVTVLNWGSAGDIPVAADFDGNGRADTAVFRPSTGVWWILRNDGSYVASQFGQNGDAPVPADYDGDGKADISVYRSGGPTPGAQGTWFVINSGNGAVATYLFGVNGDIPVPADYDGDGDANVALFRPSNGYWYRSLDPATNYDAVQWGISTDRPAPADYDGDGKADPAVVRTGSAAVWYILGTTSGVQITQFGAPGDLPAPSAYIP